MPGDSPGLLAAKPVQLEVTQQRSPPGAPQGLRAPVGGVHLDSERRRHVAATPQRLGSRSEPGIVGSAEAAVDSIGLECFTQRVSSDAQAVVRPFALQQMSSKVAYRQSVNGIRVAQQAHAQPAPHRNPFVVVQTRSARWGCRWVPCAQANCRNKSWSMLYSLFDYIGFAQCCVGLFEISPGASARAGKPLSLLREAIQEHLEQVVRYLHYGLIGLNVNVVHHSYKRCQGEHE